MLNLQREYIKNSIAYYIKDGCSESEARRPANADAKWWRHELNKVFQLNKDIR